MPNSRHYARQERWRFDILDSEQEAIINSMRFLERFLGAYRAMEFAACDDVVVRESNDGRDTRAGWQRAYGASTQEAPDD